MSKNSTMPSPILLNACPAYIICYPNIVLRNTECGSPKAYRAGHRILCHGIYIWPNVLAVFATNKKNIITVCTSFPRWWSRASCQFWGMEPTTKGIMETSESEHGQESSALAGSWYEHRALCVNRLNFSRVNESAQSKPTELDDTSSKHRARRINNFQYIYTFVYSINTFIILKRVQC